MQLARKIFRALGIFSAVILVHEGGHTIVAILLGIPVQQFSIGFGPGYTFTNIPLIGSLHFGIIFIGGYMLPDQDALLRSGTLSQLVIYLAGITANIFVAGCLMAKSSPDKVAGFLTAIIQGLVTGPDDINNGLVKPGWKGLIGPYGIMKIIANSPRPHAEVFTWLSLTLAIFNLVPIPILDGGKVVMVLLMIFFPLNWAFPLTVLLFPITFHILSSAQGIITSWLEQKLNNTKERDRQADKKMYAFLEHYSARYNINLSENELQPIRQIFQTLQSDLAIADDKEIPIVTAIANKKLTDYLRSINKLPMP